MAQEIEVKLMIEAKDAFGAQDMYTPAFFVDFHKIPKVLKDNLEKVQLMSEEHLSLENKYFDTPNFDLYKNGIALRVRRTNDKYEMTIKTKSVQRNLGVHVHSEYNISLKEDPIVPDLSAFPAEIFANIKNQGQSLASLQHKIYKNMGQACDRHVMLLKIDCNKDCEQGIVELSLDEVKYQGLNGEILGTELELELKEGNVKALWLICKYVITVLNKKIPSLMIRVGGMSKMQRAAIYANLSQIPNYNFLNIDNMQRFWQELAFFEANLFMLNFNGNIEQKLWQNMQILKNSIEHLLTFDTQELSTNPNLCQVLKNFIVLLGRISTFEEKKAVKAIHDFLGQEEFVLARINWALEELE